VLYFFQPERLDGLAQRGLVRPKRLALGGIMRINCLLHRDGAGHRRLWTQSRGNRPQRKPGNMPEWQQSRGADTALHDHLVKRVQMNLLLRLHMLQLGPKRAAPQHRQLAGIDTRRPIFTSVVDPDEPLYLIAHSNHLKLY